MIQTKRAYESPSKADGERFLVDRLWPRGVKKSTLAIAGWLKDAAPSTELRDWYGHDPAKWSEFRKRYFAELRANPAAWQPLLDAARKRPLRWSTARVRQKSITLLRWPSFSTRG